MPAFRVRNATGEAVFEARSDESILDAGLRQGRVFPYSCRDGACGSCKARLLSGEVHPGHPQPAALSEAERAAGGILLCQARARSDVVIEAREVVGAGDVEIRILPCRVAGMRRLAHDVMALRLKLPQGQRLQFLAGQYIDLLLRDGRRRSFSLANAPHEGEELEIHVRRVESGRFTRQVFETMREKDLLRLQGPLGTFFLRGDRCLPAILIGGGTGIAPLRSMVEDDIARGSTRPLRLFWGVRARRDLYLQDECESWSQRHGDLEYTPVLSEPTEADDWHGATGWVHEVALAVARGMLDYEVYASGPPPMVEAVREAFAAHGLPADRLFYDSFEFSTDPPAVGSATG